MSKAKKTFRELLTPVIETRYKNEDADAKKRRLDESTTPAAETIITYIRQWPNPSRNQALARLLECDRWTEEGTMCLETDFKGKKYPCRLPLAIGYESFTYGDLHKQVYPTYSFSSALKRIPENATEDWLDLIKKLFYSINHMPLAEFKLICLGKNVKSHGANNPYTISTWHRQCGEFADAQKAINEWIKGKKEFEYINTENLQNPKHGKEMSKILGDILARADENVERAYETIREADRKMYARQDATRARNEVKELKGFFKKYGNDETEETIKTLSNHINNTESRALNPQNGQQRLTEATT